MPDTLTAYTARILAGTGIDPAHATSVARGTHPAPSHLAAALRDGYAAPNRAPQPRPRPTIQTGDDQ
ncbi:hypothetical protein [Luteococcus sp.]|uniref:hypothetical protein n=1 Tax=Luteococcus sp. TaxID=1969402 RepID=UPI003736A0BB